MDLQYILTAGIGVITFIMIIWTIVDYIHCEKLDVDLTISTITCIIFTIIAIVMDNF